MTERDPFHEWLDHEAVRDLVHQASDRQPEERVVLLKGLVPGLMDDLGAAGFGELMGELKWKAARYDAALSPRHRERGVVTIR